MMSTFLGHALPASFFLVLGLWWTINIFKHLFVSKRKGGIPFRSQPWYPGPFGTKFPIESAVKIAVSVTAITAELEATVRTFPRDFVMSYAVHMTMFFCYGLNGIMDLLKYKGFLLPDGIEAASGVLALGVEVFLVSHHVHDGREMLDVQVHLLIVWAAIGIGLSILLECRYRDSAIPSLARAFFTLLHGTWLYQIGFIIYTPFPGMREWDMMDQEQAMLAFLFFTWHIVAIFIFMLLIGSGVMCWMKHDRKLHAHEYQLIAQEITSDKINGTKLP